MPPAPRRGGRLTGPLVTAATASYVSNVAFGVGVATGAVDNRRIRWVHHALFVGTAALTAAALGTAAVERRSAGLALLPAVGPLAVLPFAGGRVRRHAAVAAAAGPSFLAALIIVRRRQ
jgi:hypothetical protein